MSFQEKSAWIMSFTLLLAAALYFGAIGFLSNGDLPSPALPAIITYTMALVGVAVVGHIVIAVSAPQDASSSLDERERQIACRAGHLSSHVFATVIVLSLVIYMLSNNGHLLFYCVFAALMIAQLSEYLIQIILLRRGV